MEQGSYQSVGLMPKSQVFLFMSLTSLVGQPPGSGSFCQWQSI